jgi:hypothetical protein
MFIVAPPQNGNREVKGKQFLNLREESPEVLLGATGETLADKFE